MKSDTIKKLVLAALLLVFIYIWWGNLKLFFGGSSYSEQAYQTSVRADSQSAETGGLEYRLPRVNPFQRQIAAQQRRQEKPAPAKQQPRSTPKLSEAYTLAGVLTEKAEPQAVLRLPDGSSAILTVGDSIGQWRLTAIGERQVVFTHGKEHDTLRLGDTAK